VTQNSDREHVKERNQVNTNTLMLELASGLRDVILATPEGIGNEPEEVFVDLATRLVLYLQKRAVEVVPSHHTATVSTLGILTKWMRAHPGEFITKIGPTGRFELLATTSEGVQAFFQGESMQDAYAQMAQVLNLNEGRL